MDRLSGFATWALLAFMLAWTGARAQEEPWEGPSVPPGHGRLRVSENRRFLVFEDGHPFFWLGDTAWELFHRLGRQETEKYLENRRAKGITVVQAVILAEQDGLNTPNALGDKPLLDNDPARINEAYFNHVDWVLEKALEKGIFIGLLPTWGDKADLQWGKGPVVFPPEKARAYGRILGERYRHVPNIIWILGGDRQGGAPFFEVWEALASGIRSADPNHLMTFHPWGETSSSQWFHNCEWLDFNMFQSGHGQRSYAIYKRLLLPDLQRTPAKPVLDGEPRYEDHPVGWNPGTLGWFDDADVRQALYWSLFSGAFGHTYGNHAIWQMLAPGREPVGLARHTWYENLDMPGAGDLIHARRLLESRPFTERRPCQELIMNLYVPETDFIVATRGERYLMVYIPTGWAARIDLPRCGWKEARAWWFDPRTGNCSDPVIRDTGSPATFTPPGRGRGQDWVLVLDDASASFSRPGKSR